MCNIQFTTVLLYILYGSRKKTCLIVFPRTVSAHVLTYAVWEGGLHLLLNIVFAVGSVGIMSVRTSPCRNLHLPEYLIMSLYFMYYFIDLACVYIWCTVEWQRHFFREYSFVRFSFFCIFSSSSLSLSFLRLSLLTFAVHSRQAEFCGNKHLPKKVFCQLLFLLSLFRSSVQRLLPSIRCVCLNKKVMLLSFMLCRVWGTSSKLPTVISLSLSLSISLFGFGFAVQVTSSLCVLGVGSCRKSRPHRPGSRGSELFVSQRKRKDVMLLGS